MSPLLSRVVCLDWRWEAWVDIWDFRGVADAEDTRVKVSNMIEVE